MARGGRIQRLQLLIDIAMRSALFRLLFKVIGPLMSPTRFHCVGDALRGFNALPELSTVPDGHGARRGCRPTVSRARYRPGRTLTPACCSRCWQRFRRRSASRATGKSRHQGGSRSTGARMGVTAANFSGSAPGCRAHAARRPMPTRWQFGDGAASRSRDKYGTGEIAQSSADPPPRSLSAGREGSIA
ncbi:MAG: hypothetical protein CM15mP92_1630 [Halieaceae bacterium]|nr:MAG: hypothetical protein CM15mP92_1630 [Halieaceae bacterium]